MTTLDLNADLGEGFGRWKMGDDEGLLSVVSSANVACGFHAGDPTIMRSVCQRAAAENVAIGAHIGFRDLIGFGRRELPTPADELRAEALYQLGALHACAVSAGTAVRYVKPHGALYHAAAKRADIAEAIVSAMKAFDPNLVLLGPLNSESETAASNEGIRFSSEGFADRAYDDEGKLLPRSEPGSVHTDITVMAEQAKRLAVEGTVVSRSGREIALQVDSICLHGDGPGALDAAKTIKRVLLDAGVTLTSFATAP